MNERMVIVAVGVVLLAIALLLAWIPGYCARERGHPSAQAINLCGWLSLAMPVLWVVAFIWAHTGQDNSEWVKWQKAEKRRAKAGRGFPV